MSTPPPGNGSATPWWRNPHIMVPAVPGPLLVGLVLLVVSNIIDPDPSPQPPAPQPITNAQPNEKGGFAACAKELEREDAHTDDGGNARELRTIEVAPGPVDLVATNTAIFVAHKDGRVSRISVDKPSKVRTLPRVRVGSGPYGQAAIASGPSALCVVRAQKNSRRGVLAGAPRRAPGPPRVRTG